MMNYIFERSIRQIGKFYQEKDVVSKKVVPHNKVIQIIYLTFVSFSRRVHSFVQIKIIVVNDNIARYS